VEAKNENRPQIRSGFLSACFYENGVRKDLCVVFGDLK
jgi:hypothetical protein